MTLQQCDGIEMANLTAEFYSCLDDRDYEGVLRCLAPGAVWLRRGIPLVGPEAIFKALQDRPNDFHTRHLATNMRIHQFDAQNGTVTFYMLGLPHVGRIPEGEYAPVPTPHILNLYRDTMKKIDGRWLITEKRPLKTAFKDDLKLP